MPIFSTAFVWNILQASVNKGVKKSFHQKQIEKLHCNDKLTEKIQFQKQKVIKKFVYLNKCHGSTPSLPINVEIIKVWMSTKFLKTFSNNYWSTLGISSVANMAQSWPCSIRKSTYSQSCGTRRGGGTFKRYEKNIQFWSEVRVQPRSLNLKLIFTAGPLKNFDLPPLALPDSAS